jgi:hypothetical protein
VQLIGTLDEKTKVIPALANRPYRRRERVYGIAEFSDWSTKACKLVL